jgi:hypothetical protein
VLGDVTYGKDEGLEKLADKLLGGAGGKRSVERDIEKLQYEAGIISAEELRHYDPDNDWDTHDSVFALSIAPADMDGVEPTICAEVDDGNSRARNSRLQERQALMRHVNDIDSWGLDREEIPLLGANDGPRKTCRKCKLPKGLSFFSPKADSKDGLHPWCKACRKAAVSQKRKNSK